MKFFEGLFGKKKEVKNLVWDDEKVYLTNLDKEGEYRFENFSGCVKIRDTADCQVKNANFTVCITNMGYADGSVPYHAPWSVLANKITWENGEIVRGFVKGRQGKQNEGGGNGSAV